VLATQVAVFLRGDVTWRFFNAPEISSVSGNFAMLDGATREDSMDMVREMQRAVDAVAARLEEEHGRNPVAYVVAEIGGNTGGGLSGADSKDADLLGSIAIELIDADLRPYSSFAFVAQLQDEVRRLPLTETLSFRGWRGGPGGDAIDVQIYGADTATLKAAAEAVQTALAVNPEVSGLEDSMAYDREELSLELTPQGEALGFAIDDLGRVCATAWAGSRRRPSPTGRAPRRSGWRCRRASLRPISSTGRCCAPRRGLRAAGRYRDRHRAAGVFDHRPGERRAPDLGHRRSERGRPGPRRGVMETLQEVILPQVESDFGVITQLSGLAEQEREFLSDAMTGLHAVPPGHLPGPCLGLRQLDTARGRHGDHPLRPCRHDLRALAWDVPLSMFTVVGLIGMTGIIINDSIVLVTTIDEKAESRGLIPAIIDGTCDRLRPVLLTTLTTVLGLAPLLYEGSADAQFLKPTVVTLVYGLGFGMVIVLLVVPAILAMQQDFGQQVRALRRGVDVRASWVPPCRLGRWRP
jgi:hypothetical protein